MYKMQIKEYLVKNDVNGLAHYLRRYVEQGEPEPTAAIQFALMAMKGELPRTLGNGSSRFTFIEG